VSAEYTNQREGKVGTVRKKGGERYGNSGNEFDVIVKLRAKSVEKENSRLAVIRLKYK